jgi:hypothetical protein
MGRAKMAQSVTKSSTATIVSAAFMPGLRPCILVFCTGGNLFSLAHQYVGKSLESFAQAKPPIHFRGCRAATISALPVDERFKLALPKVAFACRILSGGFPFY